MLVEDFDFAIRLTNTMNWNFDEEDFQFMTNLEPEGCFVLFDDSERIGLATTIRYNKVGWLGNVIVSENYRGRGCGSLLVKNAVKYLKNNGVETVGLYAYIQRIPFYERIKFKYSSEFIHMKGKGISVSVKTPIVKASKEDLRHIIELDYQTFGASRRRLLESIFKDKGNLCYISKDSQCVTGFIMAKVYHEMTEIGPLVCNEGRDDIAIDLIKTILRKLRNVEAFLYIPKREYLILKMLKRLGFKEDFRLAKMYHGPSIVYNNIYLAESLERG